uniref:Uncharacterized protein n=1 Tax=Lepeophtheirus salmonis TaxID=72036 RepID=A0A0K2UWP8_LEPSM
MELLGVDFYKVTKGGLPLDIIEGRSIKKYVI